MVSFSIFINLFLSCFFSIFKGTGQYATVDKKHPLENPEDNGKAKKQKTLNESNSSDPKMDSSSNNSTSGLYTNGSNNKELDNKRRDEYLDNMEKIEKEFTDLKEKFFADRMAAIRKELEMLKNGRLSFI